MASSTFLLTGLALALATPIMLIALGRAVRAAGDGDFFGKHLPIALCVVVCVGSLMIGTAFLVNSLLPVVGSPILAFLLVLALQVVLLSVAIRLSGSQSTSSAEVSL